MKKVLKIFAVAMACVLLFAACQKQEEDKPANTETNNQHQTTPATPEENKDGEKQPETDPKEEILAKAQEDKEAVLAVMESVVETYRSGTLPDYYAEYPAKESYPDLSSVDNLTLEKGGDDSDVNVYVKVGEQNLCVSLKYVEGTAEGSSPWMVVKTSFGGVKG